MWVAVAVVGAAVVGAVAASSSASKQASSADKAASISAASAADATELESLMYDQTRADQMPWRDTGGGALNQLAWGMGIESKDVQKPSTVYKGTGDFGSLSRGFSANDFEQDPGYAFRQEEGLRALDRSAASRGMLLSGSQLKGVERYGQGLASQEYQSAFDRYNATQTNQFNRLGSLANVGQTANAALGQAGSQYSTNVGNIGMTNAANQGNAALAAGQAQASAYQSYGNLAGQAIGGISNWYQQK